MSLLVSCVLCGALYDMDHEPPLDDTHLSPAGSICTTSHDVGWIVEEVEEL